MSEILLLLQSTITLSIYSVLSLIIYNTCSNHKKKKAILSVLIVSLPLLSLWSIILLFFQIFTN